MKIISKKKEKQIYDQLKKLKLSCMEYANGDMDRLLEDLKIINSVAYCIGKDKGINATELYEFPSKN